MKWIHMNLKQGTIMGAKLCTSYSRREFKWYSSTLTGVYYFCKKKKGAYIGSNCFKLDGDSMWIKSEKKKMIVVLSKQSPDASWVDKSVTRWELTPKTKSRMPEVSWQGEIGHSLPFSSASMMSRHNTHTLFFPSSLDSLCLGYLPEKVIWIST